MRVAEFEVGHHLGHVQRQQFFHGLQFNDDAILDKEIDPIARIECHVLVSNRKFHLVTELTLNAAAMTCSVSLSFIMKEMPSCPQRLRVC